MLEAGSPGGQKVDLGKREPPSGKVTRPQPRNWGSREPHPDTATHKMSPAAPGTSPPSPVQQCMSSPRWVPPPPPPAVCKAGLSIQAERAPEPCCPASTRIHASSAGLGLGLARAGQAEGWRGSCFCLCVRRGGFSQPQLQPQAVVTSFLASLPSSAASHLSLLP